MGVCKSMANHNLSPEQIAQIQQLQRDFASGNFRPQSMSPLTRMRAELDLRRQAMSRYDKFILVPFPSDYPVPIQGQLVIREKDDTDPAPFVSMICDMTPAFKRGDIRQTRKEILDNEDNFDHVALSDAEWQELVQRESAQLDKIPIPFYHEALQNFAIRTDDEGEIPFHRSLLPRIKYNGYDIIPMVDALINDERGETIMFGLGLINVEMDIYEVAIFWFGNVNKRYYGNIARIMQGYFHAQAAFHICPERVIEIRPGEPDPFVDEDEPVVATTKSSPRKPQDDDRPHRTSIGRTIYIRDYPTGAPSRGDFQRHCRCWYVHGYMRTNRKTGKQTWIEGYFKGPDRNIPAARRHIKDYVL